MLLFKMLSGSDLALFMSNERMCTSGCASSPEDGLLMCFQKYELSIANPPLAVQAALQAANKERRCWSASLYVGQSDAPGVALYTHAGFQVGVPFLLRLHTKLTSDA